MKCSPYRELRVCRYGIIYLEFLTFKLSLFDEIKAIDAIIIISVTPISSLLQCYV